METDKDRADAVETPKLLTLREIVSASDRESMDVAIPEWGGTVRLQSLTGEQLMKFMEMKESSQTQATMRLLAMSIVDENGRQIFGEGEVALLRAKSLKVIKRLQDAATRLNGLDDQGQAATKND